MLIGLGQALLSYQYYHMLLLTPRRPEATVFTFTIMSTIGYGNVSPQTAGGKVFCIFFAMLAVPVVRPLSASQWNL